MEQKSGGAEARLFGRGFFAALLILTLTGTTLLPLASGRAGASAGTPQASSNITTTRSRRTVFRRTVRLSGVAEPGSDVRVFAHAGGRITSQRVEEGDRVRRGEVLFTVGGPVLEARLKTLERKTRLQKERVAIARKDVRVKREAVRQKMIRGAEVRAAEDSLKRLKSGLADMEKAAADLKRGLKVRSPVDGLFTDRKVSRGQFVERGAVLGEVISTRGMRVKGRVFLPTGAHVKLRGRKAVLNPPGGRAVAGIVTRLLPRAAVDGATVLWVEGPDIDAYLRPGEPVDGVVIVETKREALSVPAGAVVRDDMERAFVFVKKGKGYEKRAVKTGMESAGRVEITGGLGEGEEVVTSGAYELFYRDFGSVFKVAD